MTRDARELLFGALADRYAIGREIGAGAMAIVYLARDLKHDREVALKVLRPELGAVLGAERFLAEIRITARLDHPHILTLIDSGAAGGLLYYVLPLVRGESLRTKLERDKQLGVAEAVRITRQIAAALEYAHQHGVVHRDIKPENILLHEGEAMLADFGIALGVKEAGGNRLTETGLSLGTPQYMSPEQATGDRAVDARSDVYSLAAVLYEMLAGEPPVTGPTSQAMIAKLMTERPTRLRVVRPSVPPEVEDAVAKALDKTPADRFASAAEFSRAIEHHSPISGGHPRAQSAPGSRRRLIAVGAAFVTLVAAGAVAGDRYVHRGADWALKGRSQLTFTGNVVSSAISQDGKQLAYWTRKCVGAKCTYGVSVQDVGGTNSRQILDGATNSFGLEWSPDRRNLIVAGTIAGHLGYYLLSPLGGPPRLLSTGAATFWAGGDSLLLSRLSSGDSVRWVRVASLDGTVADSFRVAGIGVGIMRMSAQSERQWIVALIIQKGRAVWQVLDRKGRVLDRVTNSCGCPAIINTKELYLQRYGSTSSSIVRIGLDPSSGRLAAHEDTLYSGRLDGFSVTSDGATIVIDDVASDFSVWALELADALKGRFSDASRVLRSSTAIDAALSPDGRRLLISRPLATSSGATEYHYSITNFDGSDERPLGIALARRVYWSDSTHVGITTRNATGMHVAIVDVRSGAASRTFDVPDSLSSGALPFTDGWVWMASSRDRITVARGAEITVIHQPPGTIEFVYFDVDPSGSRVAATTWGAPGHDSAGLYVGPAAGGPLELWTSQRAEVAEVKFLDDGTVLGVFWPTAETAVLVRSRGAGRQETIGTVRHPLTNLSVSRDLKRVAAVGVEYHGDAWLSKVVRP